MVYVNSWFTPVSLSVAEIFRTTDPRGSVIEMFFSSTLVSNMGRLSLTSVILILIVAIASAYNAVAVTTMLRLLAVSKSSDCIDDTDIPPALSILNKLSEMLYATVVEVGYHFKVTFKKISPPIIFSGKVTK